MSNIFRKCSCCGRILPITEFAPKTHKCRICRRDYDWQYRYGLSPEQYFELHKSQGGKCKICGKTLPEGQYLSVDHDKQTGEVRGLLCGDCNKGLGLFHEDIHAMSRAIDYLINSEVHDED